MKHYKGVWGGYTGILTRGAIVARYNSWTLFIIFVVCHDVLLGVSYRCVKTTPCPYAYIFKDYYMLYSISYN